MMTEHEYYADQDRGLEATEWTERYFADECKELINDYYIDGDGEVIKDIKSCEIDGDEVVNFYEVVEDGEELVELITALGDANDILHAKVKQLEAELKEARNGKRFKNEIQN